jgi:hypothetical protein
VDDCGDGVLISAINDTLPSTDAKQDDNEVAANDVHNPLNAGSSYSKIDDDDEALRNV